MGTFRYAIDSDGIEHGLPDHEGYVAYWDPTCAWAGGSGCWCATWGHGHSDFRPLARAACECGWHGTEHHLSGADSGGLSEAEEEPIMAEWDAHTDPLLHRLTSVPERRRALAEQLGVSLGLGSENGELVTIRLEDLERLADHLDRSRARLT